MNPIIFPYHIIVFIEGLITSGTWTCGCKNCCWMLLDCPPSESDQTSRAAKPWNCANSLIPLKANMSFFEWQRLSSWETREKHRFQNGAFSSWWGLTGLLSCHVDIICTYTGFTSFYAQRRRKNSHRIQNSQHTQLAGWRKNGSAKQPSANRAKPRKTWRQGPSGSSVVTRCGLTCHFRAPRNDFSSCFTYRLSQFVLFLRIISEVRTNKHTLSECKWSWNVKCAKRPGIWKQLRRPSVEVERFQTIQLRILKWRESCVKIKVWRGWIVHWIVLAVMPEHHKAGYKEPQHRLWHWAAVRYASRYIDIHWTYCTMILWETGTYLN